MTVTPLGLEEDHDSASVRAQLGGMDAAIWWLADDFRWSRALDKHYGASDGRCIERCGTWPCLQYRLAEPAQAVHESRLRTAEHRDDAPFRYAIHANSIETTTPMRAVARTPSTAPSTQLTGTRSTGKR